MLITELVEVTIGGRNIKHYQGLGYDACFNKTIKIPIEHLTKGSHVKVDVKCDYCGEHYFKTYKNYLRQRDNGKDCCKKCQKYKMEETCLEIYGVKNYNQTDEGKLKSSNYWKNLSDEEMAEIHNKMKETCLEKYGYKSPSESPKIKEKIMKTNLKRYGHKSTMQNENVKRKHRDNCIEKYGVSYVSQIPEVRIKVMKTLMNNGLVPTSKQQIEIYETIKTLFNDNNVFLNYPFYYYSLDVVLFINEIK